MTGKRPKKVRMIYVKQLSCEVCNNRGLQQNICSPDCSVKVPSDAILGFAKAVSNVRYCDVLRRFCPEKFTVFWTCVHRVSYLGSVQL